MQFFYPLEKWIKIAALEKKKKSNNLKDLRNKF